MKSGQTEHWFVVYHDGQPSLATASRSRRGAIANWHDATWREKSWRSWYRLGMRTRRVKIRWQIQP